MIQHRETAENMRKIVADMMPQNVTVVDDFTKLEETKKREQEKAKADAAKKQQAAPTKPTVRVIKTSKK